MNANLSASSVNGDSRLATGGKALKVKTIDYHLSADKKTFKANWVYDVVDQPCPESSDGKSPISHVHT